MELFVDFGKLNYSPGVTVFTGSKMPQRKTFQTQNFFWNLFRSALAYV